MVAITAPSTVIVVGASITLTANVYDQDAKLIPNVVVAWRSLNPTVASISPSGIVTGVSVGNATIEAEASGKKGSFILNVDPDPCVNPIDLAVGQFRMLSGPAAVSCVTLAATSGPTDFLFVTANADQAQDNKGFYSVALSLGDLPSATRMATALAFDPRVFLAQEAIRRVDQVESRIRLQERTLFQAVRPPGGLRPEQPGGMASVAAAVAAEGDTLKLNVPDLNSSNLCTTGYKEIRGVIRKLGQHVTVVEDVAAPSGGFSASDFTALAAEFDNLIYPADTLYFGHETDRNQDGRVTVLYTPEVNRATPNGAAGFVAGFFWGGDLVRKVEYERLGMSCPQTNEQEIFYMLVPDPSGTINGNLRSVQLVRQNTRGTLAHEFQHMINQGRRLLNPAVDSSETAWLNEGLSHFAEEIVGRVQRGFTDFQRLTWSDVNPDPNATADFDAFFRQNLARYRSWMQRPDTSSPTSNLARSQLAPRGAAWMFLRYTADRYSGGNMKAFLRSVVAGPDIGLRNLLQHVNGAQYDDLLSGWLVSQFTDGLDIPGLDPRYTMASWSVRNTMAGYNKGVFPLLVTPLPASMETQSISGSGNYFRLTRTGPSPETTFRMVAPGGSNVGFTGARVYVVRMN